MSCQVELEGERLPELPKRCSSRRNTFIRAILKKCQNYPNNALKKHHPYDVYDRYANDADDSEHKVSQKGHDHHNYRHHQYEDAVDKGDYVKER